MDYDLILQILSENIDYTLGIFDGAIDPANCPFSPEFSRVFGIENVGEGP